MAARLMMRSVQDDSVRDGPIPLPAIEITREFLLDSARGARLHVAGLDEFDDLLRTIANAKAGMDLAGATPIRLGFSATDYATIVRAVAQYLKCPYATITRMWLAGVRAEIINDTCVGQFQLLATDRTTRYLTWGADPRNCKKGGHTFLCDRPDKQDAITSRQFPGLRDPAASPQTSTP